jgi:hypothetical protein
VQSLVLDEVEEPLKQVRVIFPQSGTYRPWSFGWNNARKEADIVQGTQFQHMLAEGDLRLRQGGDLSAVRTCTICNGIRREHHPLIVGNRTHLTRETERLPL